MKVSIIGINLHIIPKIINNEIDNSKKVKKSDGKQVFAKN